MKKIFILFFILLGSLYAQNVPTYNHDSGTRSSLWKVGIRGGAFKWSGDSLVYKVLWNNITGSTFADSAYVVMTENGGNNHTPQLIKGWKQFNAILPDSLYLTNKAGETLSEGQLAYATLGLGNSAPIYGYALNLTDTLVSRRWARDSLSIQPDSTIFATQYWVTNTVTDIVSNYLTDEDLVFNGNLSFGVAASFVLPTANVHPLAGAIFRDGDNFKFSNGSGDLKTVAFTSDLVPADSSVFATRYWVNSNYQLFLSDVAPLNIDGSQNISLLYKSPLIAISDTLTIDTSIMATRSWVTSLDYQPNLGLTGFDSADFNILMGGYLAIDSVRFATQSWVTSLDYQPNLGLTGFDTGDFNILFGGYLAIDTIRFATQSWANSNVGFLANSQTWTNSNSFAKSTGGDITLLSSAVTKNAAGAGSNVYAISGQANVTAGYNDDTEAFGVYGNASGGVVNYAGFFSATADTTGNSAYGIYATAGGSNGATAWAAYFSGNTYVGTVKGGEWLGTDIADDYIASASTWNGKATADFGAGGGASGYYAATTSGGSPTSQMPTVAVTINGNTYNLIYKP